MTKQKEVEKVRCVCVKRCPHDKCSHHQEHEPVRFHNQLLCTQTVSVRCGLLPDLPLVWCEPVTIEADTNNEESLRSGQ